MIPPSDHPWPRPEDEDDALRAIGPHERQSAMTDMLSIGGFDDTPAFHRWAMTDEAIPVLLEYLALRRTPLPTEAFSIDLERCEREIEAQDALRADIEARFG